MNYLAKLIFVVLIISGCKNETKTVNKSINRKVSQLSSKNNYLLIEGTDIWVREQPKTGKVILKLNDGIKCKIIDTSKLDTIKVSVDYWYKIKFNDTIGWIFGSQTNIKSESSKNMLFFFKENKERLNCKNINYKLLKEPIASSEYLSSIILFSGKVTIDTLNFKRKKLSYENKENAHTITKDLNFDGICDFIYVDLMSASHSELDYYYFIYDIKSKGYKENYTLPKRHGGMKLNLQKKELIFYFPYDSSYKTFSTIDNEHKFKQKR